MDRQGADFMRVVNEIGELLHANAIPVQLPIGTEDAFEGVIDLIRMKAWIWNSVDGKDYTVTDIPVQWMPEAEQGHKRLLEELSLVDESIFDQFTTDPSGITATMIVQSV